MFLPSPLQSVNKYLKDPALGGFRLNTDFGLKNYLDLGRAFGFAYGTKENGAFFSHMNVMYAFALYKGGFVKEGYEVLRSIYKMCMDTEKSKIYPGIPEYFDSLGRGRYHYLTGSASWYILTQVIQVYGVRGLEGDLLLSPKLMKEEFSEQGIASIRCQFAERFIEVRYHNQNALDHSEYKIKEIHLNGKPVEFERVDHSSARIPRQVLLAQNQGVKLDCFLF